MEVRVYLVSLLVVMINAYYYFIYREFPVNISFINSVFAFSAVYLIAMSLLMGSLGRFFPKQFSKYVHDRKTYGLFGYALAGIHVLLASYLLLSETREIFLADIMSLAVAAVAFVIFTIMAFTSTSSWIKSLGYENWKNLQRMGYIAIVLVVLHFLLLEKGVFISRLTGQVASLFVLAVLVLRALAIVLKRPSPAKK